MSAICIKRTRVEDKQVFMIKHGEVGVQLDEEQAEYICRTLALFMGLSIVDQRENIRVLNERANQNDLEENYLGA